MGILAVGGLSPTKPAEGNSQQDENADVFGRVLGRTMDSASRRENAQCGSKVHKQKTDTVNDEASSTEEESRNRDAMQSLPVVQMPQAPDATLTAHAVIGTLSFQPQNADGVAANSALPKLAESTQSLFDAVSVISDQSVPATVTDQVMTNVMTALRQSGEAVQQELETITMSQFATELTSRENTAPVSQEVNQSPYQSVAVAATTDVQLSESSQNAAPDAGVTASDGAAEQSILLSQYENHSELDSSSDNSDPSNPVQDIEKSKKSIASEASSVPFISQVVDKTNHPTELLEVSQAIDKAIDRFETDFQGLRAETTSIQIELEPRELGALTITLVSGTNGVSAKIKTDNADVANLIGDQIHRMAQSLEAKGVRVENVEVVFSQTASENFGGGQSGAGQSDNAPNPQIMQFFAAQTQPDQVDALNIYESAAEYYAAEDGVGQSVEYRI